MRSTPAWSRASQPWNPPGPTIRSRSMPRMMSEKLSEPLSASVSCYRSRLTTSWIGRPTRLLLIIMSSFAAAVSVW